MVKEWIEHLEKLIQKFNITKVKKIVPGGKTGQDSIFNGLKAAEEVGNRNKDIVLIHDDIVSVKKHGSAITSVKVKETVLIVDNSEKIIDVPNRAQSRLARAPQ